MAQQTLTVRDTTPLYNLFDEENQAPSFRHSLCTSMKTTFPLAITLEWVSPWLSPGSLSFRSPLWTSLLHCCISSLQLDGDIYSIAVSKELVLTGSCGRRVHARQPHDCHTKGYIHASSGEVRAMVAHGDLLFTSHKDRKVRIWSVKTYGSYNNPTFRPKKITTLPSASRFKNFVSNPITPHYNKVTHKPITSHHRDTISCMAYYHVEEILYTGSYDRTVKAWRVNQKKCVDSFIAHVGHVSDMVVDQQHGYVFTCSSDGTLKMWIMRVVGPNNYSHALVKVLAFRTYPIHALALSGRVSSLQDSSFLYSGSSNGSINFWEQCSRYTHGGFLQGHRFSILCLATLENFVISGSEDSTIRIWKRQIGGSNHECLAVLEGHRGPVRCLATHLLKDKFGMSFLVYSASSDHTFKVWRVKQLTAEIEISPFREDDEEEEDDTNNDLDFETSPVLSPSWVKKKLQYSSLHTAY